MSTTPQRNTSILWLPFALLGSAVAVGSIAALATTGQTPRRLLPGLVPFDERDVEAVARMLASENPRGSLALHIEQVFTQVRRALKRGVSLYDQITAGSGYGGQGEREPGEGRRPVATERPATPVLRERARAILEGAHASQYAGATKFFEPQTQDRAFAIAEIGRMKKTVGLPLTKDELRLLKYKRDAGTIRADWRREGARPLGQIDGVEFWS